MTLFIAICYLTERSFLARLTLLIPNAAFSPVWWIYSNELSWFSGYNRNDFSRLNDVTWQSFPARKSLSSRCDFSAEHDSLAETDFFFKGKYILSNESFIHSILFIECISSSFIFILLNECFYLQITVRYSLRSDRVCWSNFHILLELNLLATRLYPPSSLRNLFIYFASMSFSNFDIEIRFYQFLSRSCFFFLLAIAKKSL